MQRQISRCLTHMSGLWQLEENHTRRRGLGIDKQRGSCQLQRFATRMDAHAHVPRPSCVRKLNKYMDHVIAAPPIPLISGFWQMVYCSASSMAMVMHIEYRQFMCVHLWVRVYVRLCVCVTAAPHL